MTLSVVHATAPIKEIRVTCGVRRRKNINEEGKQTMSTKIDRGGVKSITITCATGITGDALVFDKFDANNCEVTIKYIYGHTDTLKDGMSILLTPADARQLIPALNEALNLGLTITDARA